MLLSRVVGVCLAFGVAACTSVRPVAPSKLSAKQLPQVVSVTYPDKTVLVLMDPELSSDTLRGLRWGTQDSVVILLDSVQTVQARVPDGPKTFLLATTVALLVASGAYVVMSKTGEQDNSLNQCFDDSAMKHPEEFPQCGH